MTHKQSGFTLIEIAIVLVIIGLLLGGVLKGQELINSAKVKNLAFDFKNTAIFIYSYQDKYHALPGDDVQVVTHVTGATKAVPATLTDLGNGRIDGKWDSTTITDESFLFWQHVRLAGIASGSTNTGDVVTYQARNTLGGLIGITNSISGTAIPAQTGAGLPIAGLKGAYIICSANILGKFAKQLDIMMDDGVTNTGSMQTQTTGQAAGAIDVAAVALPDDTTLYTVCMGV